MESYRNLFENRLRFSEKMEFIDEFNSYYSGQSNNTLKYGNTETNEVFGYIEYSVYNNQYYIDYIFVEPKYRGQNIGQKLVDYLVKESKGYKNIEWGMTTPDGQKLKNKMDKIYKGK
jgi:ribosomal protein S18 acetylase RimI-like enzyme